jgi:thymidine kinase
MIELITGPMFSGKSDLLISKAQTIINNGETIYAVKSSINKRDKTINSRTGRKFANCHVHTNLCEIIENGIINKFKYFFIDEGQFFEDIDIFIEKVAENTSRNVYIAALISDVNINHFGNIYKAATFIDKFIILDAICKVCEKTACYSARVGDDTAQIIIDNGENYYPTCSLCHPFRSSRIELLKVNKNNIDKIIYADNIIPN